MLARRQVEEQRRDQTVTLYGVEQPQLRIGKARDRLRAPAGGLERRADIARADVDRGAPPQRRDEHNRQMPLGRSLDAESRIEAERAQLESREGVEARVKRVRALR